MPVRTTEMEVRRCRPRPPFALFFVVLVFATIAGAVVGAALRGTPENRHLAEAAVLAGGEGTADEVQRLAELIRLPFVATLARAQLSEVVDFDPRVSVQPRPELGMVAIRVAATSPELARLFADALAAQSISFNDVVQASGGSAIPLGDFEDGYGAWLSGARTLGPSTGNVVLSLENPRFNDASMEVDCSGSTSCAFSRLVYYPFRVGGRYRFAGWVRGDPGTVVSVAVGAPGDMDTSDIIRLSSLWRRVHVDWVPATDHQFAELRWQADSTSARFSLDGVWMADGAALGTQGVALPTGPSEARIFERQDIPRTLPAVAAGTLDAPTLRAALLGALLGFLTGSVALGLLALLRGR